MDADVDERPVIEDQRWMVGSGQIVIKVVRNVAVGKRSGIRGSRIVSI